LVFCAQSERKEKLFDGIVLSKMKAIKTQCENKNCDGHYLLFVLSRDSQGMKISTPIYVSSAHFCVRSFSKKNKLKTYIFINSLLFSSHFSGCLQVVVQERKRFYLEGSNILREKQSIPFVAAHKQLIFIFLLAEVTAMQTNTNVLNLTKQQISHRFSKPLRLTIRFHLEVIITFKKFHRGLDMFKKVYIKLN
jgi:hypothetical protein